MKWVNFIIYNIHLYGIDETSVKNKVLATKSDKVLHIWEKEVYIASLSFSSPAHNNDMETY